MASVKRITVIRYVLQTGTNKQKRPVYSSRCPDGAHVNRDTPGAIRLKKTSSIWWGSWRGTDGKPTPYVSLKTNRREVADQIVRERERVALLGAEGLKPTANAERLRPLVDHLEDYRRHLAAGGRSPKHVRGVVTCAASILDGCRFVLPADLDPDEVLEYLAELRTVPAVPKLTAASYSAVAAGKLVGIGDAPIRAAIRAGELAAELVEGRRGPTYRIARGALAAYLENRGGGFSHTTSNHYLQAIKQFSHWLRRKTKNDPLEDLEKLNADTDRRRLRRALSLFEAGQLVVTTRGGEVSWELSGASRATLYHTALRTGLRVGELASLSGNSLDTAKRTLVVEAGSSKRRRRDIIELRADLAAELIALTAGRDPSSPIWPGRWAGDAAKMLREDLQAAGVPYANAAGEVCDFHAMRTTFIVHLIEAGVAPKLVQILARHSNISLTMDLYGRTANKGDGAATIEGLPPLCI